MKANLRRRQNRLADRRGAVSVEFAVVAPVFMAIVLGIYQASVMHQRQNLLTLAAREGARFGAMDRSGMLAAGVTANSKLEADVKNFLRSSGIDSDDINVYVTHADDPTLTFDLDDPDNDLKLFEVRVELPYQWGAYTADDEFKLIGKVVFRNARAAIVQ